MRDIEIGVINRNTLAERTVRYRERWRYDEAAKTWWLARPAGFWPIDGTPGHGAHWLHRGPA
jgi:hypothetical protein